MAKHFLKEDWRCLDTGHEERNLISAVSVNATSDHVLFAPLPPLSLSSASFEPPCSHSSPFSCLGKGSTELTHPELSCHLCHLRRARTTVACVCVCTHNPFEQASPQAGIVAVGGSCQHEQAALRLHQGTWLTLGECVRTSHAIGWTQTHGCTRVLTNRE